MKLNLAIVTSIFFLFGSTITFAASYPNGDITIYNTSDQVITAEVSSSSFGRFSLASNEKKTVAYSSLIQVCSASPTNCKTQFYINNTPAGSATINVVTGKLVNMNLSRKVHTAKSSEQVLRTVIIK